MAGSAVASNLFVAWVWMFLGFLSGAVLGSFFH
jgi:hypothetical protein